MSKCFDCNSVIHRTKSSYYTIYISNSQVDERLIGVWCIECFELKYPTENIPLVVDDGYICDKCCKKEAIPGFYIFHYRETITKCRCFNFCKQCYEEDINFYGQ